MLQCKNCGAFLTKENGTKCFVCNYDNKNDYNMNDSANRNGVNVASSANNIDTVQTANSQSSNGLYSAHSSHSSHSSQGAHSAQRSGGSHNASVSQSSKQASGVRTSQPTTSAKAPQKRQNMHSENNSRTKSFASVREGRTPAISKTIVILLCILSAALILLAGTSIASNLLYSSYSQGAFFTQLETALIASDVGTLQTLVVGEGIEVTDAGLSALSRQFQTKQQVEALVASFNIKTGENELTSDTYSSLSLLSNGVFLGYNEYKIQVKPVDLNVPVISENAVLTMDSIPMIGTYANENMTYTGIFPGVYTAVVTDQTLVGQSIQGEAIDIALFDSNVAYVFSGALPISDITVAGCAQDSGIIYVNDVQVNAVPVGGVVTVPGVLVGSNIKIVITTQSGATAASVVQYAEKDVTQLSFTEYSFSGGMPTQEQADATISAFFASYLSAINAKDPAILTNCTEEFRTSLTSEVSGDLLPVVFEFVQTTADAARAQQSFNAANVHTVSVNVATEYTSTPRTVTGGEENAEGDEGEAPPEDSTAAQKETLTPHLTMELVYSQDGVWLVNAVRENSIEQHTAGIIAPMA